MVVFDTLFYILGISLVKVAFPSSSIGKVDNDELGSDGDDLGKETFNDLPLG